MTLSFQWWCWCSTCSCPGPETPPLSAGARRFLWRSGPWTVMSCLCSALSGAWAGLGCGSRSGQCLLLSPQSSGGRLHHQAEKCTVRCSSPLKHSPQHLWNRWRNIHQGLVQGKNLIINFFWPYESINHPTKYWFIPLTEKHERWLDNRTDLRIKDDVLVKQHQNIWWFDTRDSGLLSFRRYLCNT